MVGFVGSDSLQQSLLFNLRTKLVTFGLIFLFTLIRILSVFHFVNRNDYKLVGMQPDEEICIIDNIDIIFPNTCTIFSDCFHFYRYVPIFVS